ncbi:MAG: SDR family NAD(P)-dependent oxidoreductase [Alphaproteobacteria bacterium]|nr:SDR family NAD(P)-dependent oxidoreductase [Alphaproteobacteria bacterium]
MAGTREELSPLKRALIAVRELKEKVARLEAGESEPIAVVGIGCRFPGVRGPKAFWKALVDGVDATTEVPPGRWDALAWDRDGAVPRRGAFLDGIEGFDAGFFGISPREALEMDPAQRLLLQVAWEALEDAGIPATGLAGTATAVYLGLGLSDYGRRHFLGGDPTRLTPYSGTGTFLSVAAGRIAYTLGLTGPALTIDTACSSSLVAADLAVAALRSRDADLALAAGANLVISPMPTAYFARLQALAPDGRCKTFDAAADGYGRGEGVGVVVLKRLSDAIRDGDAIRAVIRGTAVNQDGRSNGLTAPSGTAQQAVIRAALADGGLVPADIGLIEAHGTGTPLGDPIEVDALRAVFGGHTPLRLGSVKTNFGHTETAAGVAGLVKATLALEHGAIPRHNHLHELNPRIRLDDVGFEIPTAHQPWPDGLPRRAGVSSFGLSGTNAHVVLEAPPLRAIEPEPDGPHLLVLSARSEMALAQLAERTAGALREGSLADACDTAFHGRAALPWRVAVAARTGAEAGERLRDAVRRGADGGKLGWLFTGQGSQWPAMGRGLYEGHAGFRAVVDRVADAMALDLREVWLSGDPRIGHTRYTQPALYALQCGLAQAFADQGLEPTALLGHSIGEFAAAWYAGVFSLEDGARLVEARGRLMGDLPDDAGAMLAVFAPASAVPDLPEGVALAAVNHPAQMVLSGAKAAVAAFAQRLADLGLETRRLAVSHAFHSPLMDPILDAFREVVRGVPLAAPRLRVVSALDGELLGERATDPDYWVRQLREPVRFADGLLAMMDCRVFLELGPHPVLTAAGARTLPEARFVASLRRDGDAPVELLESVGQLWASGIPITRPTRVHPRFDLPTMPFQEERFWLDVPVAVAGARSDATHRLAWVEAPAPPDAAPRGVWWVLADGPTDVELALAASGVRVLRVRPGTDFEGEGDEITVDPGDPAHFQWLRAHAGRPDGVLVLWGLTEPVRSRDGLLAVLAVARVAEAPVSVVVPADRPSGLPGLVRVLRSEHPERVGTLAHVGEGVEARRLLAEIASGTPEVLLGAARRVPRLRRAGVPEAPPLGRTVWVTGASGDLGRQLARRLAKEVDSLVLVSRSGIPEDELLRLGPHVRSVQGDVTDNLVPLAAEVPPDLIFHLAGARDDAPSDAVDADTLEAALHAKVDGAWRLNEVAPDAELVLVGSAAAVLGNPGQAAYAAANAWLEGFARWRTAQGARTWCVAPGPIAGTSMTAGLADRFASVGARELGVGECLDLVLAVRGSAEPVLVVAPFDWERWARAVPSSVLDELAPPAPAEPAEPTDVPALVAREVARVLGRSDPPPADQGFFDAGMDSLMAAELRTRLAAALHRDLPASIAFDHPSRAALVRFLGGEEPAVAEVAAGPATGGAVAIVGIGCRLPGGVEGPDALWDFLVSGGDGVRRIDRWDIDALYDPTPATPGRTYVRHAGLLDDIERFDAAAFGIAPREASRLDPQQRLVLEASLQALEHAGIRADRLGRALTGVYVGIGRSEYGRRFDPLDVDAEPDPYSGTGNESSFAAGRVAYVLGLQGPAIAVDTACSSSLVTVHLAVQALRAGQCRVALAGGVNAITAPDTTVQLSQIRALAPDGRCKTFDASADGYGRGEGVGMLVLKRLEDAEADGDRIWAVVRGSAVNHDGASSGLTVPNGSAQRAVIRAALADARVDPADVGLLEAHGTGTRLGDPIEIEAARSVYVDGQDRAEPLHVGSIKTNVGHLEAGAGVAGLLRATLALHHRVVPPHRNLVTPNPELALDGIAIDTAKADWSARFAAVSSFGISGTNAHVVLERGPALADDPAPPRAHRLLVASGATVEAAIANRQDADPRALGEVRRPAPVRTWAVDGAWSDPEPVVEGKVAWLFTGQGAQWRGMGLALLDEPVFAATFERCAAVMAEHGLDLRALLDSDDLDHTAITQPCTLALELALADWLRSRGLQPDLVMGHSLGEWSAAVAAGVLDADDALRLVIRRGELMGALPAGGTSAAVFCDADRVRAAIGDDPVDISGLNGSIETVLAGERAAVEAVVARLGVEARFLKVSHAFHSRLVEPAVEPFREAVAGVSFRTPRIPFVTNADGARAGERVHDPAHWAGLIREAVHFGAGMQTLVDLGARVFLEVGPRAVLSRMAARTVEGRFVSTLTLDGGSADLYRAVGALWAAGVEPDWAAVTGASRPGLLPPTPFHRVRHWVDREADAPAVPERLVYRAEWRAEPAEPASPGTSDVWMEEGDAPGGLLEAVRDAAARGRPLAIVTREGSAAVGFARALALEEPERVGGLVVCGPDVPLETGLAHVSGGEVGCFPDRRVRRLVRAKPVGRLPVPDGEVLVTGGSGAIGRAVAEAWRARGARVVVLSRAAEPWDGIEVVNADLSDAEAVRAGLAGRDVRGVVHCAGTGRRVPWAEEDEAGLRAVFAAKVDGARALDALFPDLDFFVLVSSIAAVWGSAGQVAYAAANAALDGIAAGRRARGQLARVVALGTVRGGLLDAEGEAWLAARGLKALSPRVAAEAILSCDGVVAEVDWDVFGAVMRAPALFADVLPPRPERRAGPVAHDVFDLVRRRAARVLGLEPEALDPRQGFFDAGMDSLTAVELAAGLAKDLGRDVPGTIAFEHGSVEAVVAWLQPAEAPVLSASMLGRVDDADIAIVGMACRFPGGVDTPEAFWELLRSGRDAVTRVPADRWDADRWFDPEPATPGKSYVREAAFVDGIDRFDPLFFGMSPREAASLDPQQRLLLEVSHEALERAGLAGSGLKGSSIGVFCGIPESSYLNRFRAAGAPFYPDEYAGTGNEASFAAGRIAFSLGVHGPAVAFNTACSSSLVAVHLAAEALRSGDCDAALAGGVSLMLSPDNHVYLSQLRALAPDGRCKTFDAGADGYGRGEGAGMLALMRLSDAEARGMPVLAVVKGTAVNHDGPSSGLTVPNGSAQERVVAEALRRSGLQPGDVTYIEAHGTGTKLGDPIEVRALQRVFGEAPLWLASVKTQIGHLEQAAGVAALMKVVLQQQHGEIAPHLHLAELNPEIALGAMRIPTAPTLWEGPQNAGVSGFGLSGTNAHVVVAPGAARPAPVRSHAALIPVSAPGEAAVLAQIERIQPALEALGSGAVAGALWRRRHFDHRAVLVDGVPGPVRRANPAPRVALLFTGQGAQSPGMARALYEADAVFRTAVDDVCALADRFLPRPLWEAMADDAVDDTRFTQPALFAVEWGLASWWRERGVEADVVLGHSVGELVAATWAGMLSLADGVELVCARANAMADLPRDGAMAAVFASEAVVGGLLDAGVEIAGINNPDEVVVSGRTDAVRALLKRLPEGTRSRELTVSHAFHSALMEPMLAGLTEVASRLVWHEARVPVGRNVDGTLAKTPPEPGYWARQVRSAVRFADGVRAAKDAGITTWLEVGPHPVLAGHVLQLVPGAMAVGSLHRKVADRAQLLDAAGALWTDGVAVDLSPELPDPGPVELPTTPFARVRCWLDLPEYPGLAGALDDALLELDWVPVDGPRLAGPFRSDDPEVQAALTAAGRASPEGMPIHIVGPIDDADALEAALSGLLAAWQGTPGPRVVAVRGDGLALAVRGFFRAAWAEQRDAVLVELEGSAEALVDGLIEGEPHLRVGPDGVRAARLREASVLHGSVAIHGDRSYVVSGGFGGLGLAVAGWLAERGAGEVLLLSRNPRPEALAGLPDTVRGLACDVSDASSVREALATAKYPVGGVLHAAGVLEDAALASQTPERIANALRAKVRGALALHEALPDGLADPDGFFALFSSASATMGSAGQVPYAAANAALDGLAARWRREGFPAVSIGWGPWAEVGMAAAMDARLQAAQRSRGIRTLPVADGLVALDRLLASGRAHTLVLPMDWSRFVPAEGSPLVEAFGWRRPSLAAEASRSERDRILDAPDRHAALLVWIERVARDVLRIPADSPVDPGRPLGDYGMDSLMAVQVRNGLDDGGFEVPIARLIGGPSVEEIAAILLSTLPAAEAPFAAAATPVDEVEWYLRPPVTHALVALWALVVGAAIMWTAMGLTHPPQDATEHRGPPPRADQ